MHETIEADVRVFLRIGDVDEPAVSVAGEGNANGIIRLDRRLGHMEVCLLLHQGVVVLLGDPQGPEGAVGFLVESHHLLVHARGIGADFVIALIGLHCAILPCIGDESAAIELGGLPLAGVGNLFALLLHFFHRGIAVGNAPPVEFAAVEFVSSSVAGLLTGLVIVPKALPTGGIGIVRSRTVVGGGMRFPGGCAIIVFFHHCLDLPVFTSVSGLAGDLSGLIIQVGDLDDPFGAGAGGETSDFQVLCRIISDFNISIAIPGFKLCLAGVGGGIQDRAYQGNMAAAGFYVVHQEAIVVEIKGEEFRPVLREAFAFHMHNNRAVRGEVILRSDVVLYHVPAGVGGGVVQLVILRNVDGHIGVAALDLGIDIEIAGTDENISIGRDAFADAILLLPGVRQRRAADIRDGAALCDVVGLDVVAILHVQLHRAREDGALVVNIAVLADAIDAASGVIDVAGEVSLGRTENRDISQQMILRHEMVGNLYRRQVGGVAVLDGSKSHVLRLIPIEFLDGILHMGHITANGGIVVVNRAALPCAACARAAGDGDIADLEIVRRIVADGDAAIAVGREAAGAIDIVPFHIDIPQLGSDAIQLQVMDQIVVAFLVKQVVVGRAFGDRLKIHRITIGVYRFDSLAVQREAASGSIFCAATCKEFLGGIDLGIQAVDFLIVLPVILQFGVVVMEVRQLIDILRQRFRSD